jgi:hypothetical protein
MCSGQAAAAPQQQRALVQLPRAVKDEEAEIDRITKEAAQSDIWGNEVAGNAVKVSGSRLLQCGLQKPDCLPYQKTLITNPSGSTSAESPECNLGSSICN